MDNTAQQDAYHYRLIARALQQIDGPGGQSLSLDDLAGRLGMSAPHFQRVFSAWVGVSPKRYQQYLTLDHAKTLLAQRFTTLGTAIETGLSGSGRLHDLFLSWEAMSPGEFARGGDGLVISYGWFPSPFGEALVMGTERGLCGVGFSDECGRAHAMADLRARWPKARYIENPDAIRPWAEAAFGGSGKAQLYLMGAPFQIKVWEALLAIPTGHVTTYSELARVTGHPTAMRAVGTAVGRNPISWLIPCHRALRKSGGLGGYHWGLPVKRAMLAYEAARADSAA